ncbi:dihydrofolate reductase family protein [Luteibacter sp. SG786]|uniref:dihydrofolate reductase family protein n=1 Tax=Luteibacter sp. SG786 TaxID=2587130 RepID=UPI0014221E70|nr:dihydrofolate reductase family protein [Luteibacter sp. SG786]NII54807.1 dihydrofolate reductase [Luteibacter sp. SG786]
MARLVYALNQSLDGYVEHEQLGPPDPALFRHFIEDVRSLTGMLYGRRMYEVMRYWDDDLPEWGADEREYAAAWRSKPKWVVSRSLEVAGPNAGIVGGDVALAVRRLKAEHDGVIEVAGPELAGSLSDAGLIDEYRLYIHPVVLGRGKPFFSGAVPRLRFVGSELMGGDVVRLSYVPS